MSDLAECDALNLNMCVASPKKDQQKCVTLLAQENGFRKAGKKNPENHASDRTKGSGLLLLNHLYPQSIMYICCTETYILNYVPVKLLHPIIFMLLKSPLLLSSIKKKTKQVVFFIRRPSPPTPNSPSCFCFGGLQSRAFSLDGLRSPPKKTWTVPKSCFGCFC